MKGQTKLNGHSEITGAEWNLPPNVRLATQDDRYRLFVVPV